MLIYPRIFLILVLLIITTLLQPAYAIHFPKPPRSHHFYVDQANLIQPAVKDEINKIAGKLWNERKIPFFVVTIPSLITQGAPHYSIKDYAKALFTTWGIGSKEKSYGILLLVSKAERLVGIVLGAGFGHSFESQELNIVKQMVTPDFDQGNYSDGILKGVMRLNEMTIGIHIPHQSQLVNHFIVETAHSSWYFPLFEFIIACSMLLVIISICKSNQYKQSVIKKRTHRREKNLK